MKLVAKIHKINSDEKSNVNFSELGFPNPIHSLNMGEA